jgi:hypothetical protein
VLLPDSFLKNRSRAQQRRSLRLEECSRLS